MLCENGPAWKLNPRPVVSRKSNALYCSASTQHLYLVLMQKPIVEESFYHFHIFMSKQLPYRLTANNRGGSPGRKSEITGGRICETGRF